MHMFGTAVLQASCHAHRGSRRRRRDVTRTGDQELERQRGKTLLGNEMSISGEWAFEMIFD